MSFKREGNDTSLLSKLRTRRIRELLSEDIPEDEAKLLCNGRFTCTVCPSNPIFDTVSMLNVHRKGKKHSSNMEVYLAKKRELNHLIAVRKHQQFMKDGTTSIKMAVLNNKGLLTSSPYDPRVKKSTKKSDRKPILNLESSNRMSALYLNNNYGESSSAASIFEPKNRKLPLYSSSHEKATLEANTKEVLSSSLVFKETEKQHVTKHGYQLKNIFKISTEIPKRLNPYQSKFRKCDTRSQKYRPSTSDSLQIFSKMDNTKQTLKRSDVLKNSFENFDLVNALPHRTVEGTSSALEPTQRPTKLHYTSSGSGSIANGSGVLPQKLFTAALCPLGPLPPPKSHASTLSCTHVPSLSSTPTVSDSSLSNTEKSTTAVQCQMSQKLRQLQGSGWKRDWDGKWIKDENAEFDSDEEPPDIP